jgi:uncharacterized protein YdeI (YjbR/CyaY-like superfamily)
MIYRFYDIVAESEAGEYNLNKEYRLDIPNSDMSTALDRQEHLATMFDSLVQASGCSIASFSCDPE